MTIDAFMKHMEEYQYTAGAKTRVEQVEIDGVQIPQFINEFWTAKQRQASSLHEVSYRACFKPQLPRFFIQAMTEPGDIVYDPFSGRGTTVIEAGLLGRGAIANDINPLSALLSQPRFFVPSMEQIAERLGSIPQGSGGRADIDLSMFYHRDTQGEIVALRDYLLEREALGVADWTDRWIRMVATNRLTGHSGGFFSVYTLPPNQAVTAHRQVLINQKRNQVPEYKDIKSRILKKSSSLLKNLTHAEIGYLKEASAKALFLCNDARYTPEIESESVKLTITSPPFLDVVQYSQDNWLRCWFNGISAEEIGLKITMAKTVDEWTRVMQDVFRELFRITAPGGWVAFEVGEVKGGTVKLDEYVVPLGREAGFKCVGVLLNVQEFTKTANIWGVKNNAIGTNTNRVVVFYKEQ